MRKKRWIVEWRCKKFGMNIIAKMSFCDEPYEKNCKDCPYKEEKKK